MNSVSRKIIAPDGTVLRCKVDLRNNLNYNYLNLTDMTVFTGAFDIPTVYCNTMVFPDYLALYSQAGYYHKTANTGVCFYQYDRVFDGIDGIYNAIYYNNKKLLKKYKKRFDGVKFFIMPDYSVFGDIDKAENINRLKKSRIVALWLSCELGAVVIPNLMYVSAEEMPIFCSGIENCSVLALSLKSHVRRASERNLTKAAVKYAVDNMPLKAIVVYSGCGKDETALAILKYATDNGIKIIIPENSLRERNRGRCA